MATFPCSRCGRRYAGPQQTAYPAFVNGTVTWSARLRLCPPCFQELVQASWLEFVGGSTPHAEALCFCCEQAKPEWRVFIPYYEAGQERQDMYGQLCTDCYTESILEWVFGAAQPAQVAYTPQDGS